MSAHHGLKLIQVSGVAPGTYYDNDHVTDSVDEDNAQFIYSDAPLAQPVGSTLYFFEIWLCYELIRKPRSAITDFVAFTSPRYPDYPNNKIEYWFGHVARGGSPNFGYATPVNSLSTKVQNRAHTSYYSEATALAISGSLSNIGDKTGWLVIQGRALVGAGKRVELFRGINFYPKTTPWNG